MDSNINDLCPEEIKINVGKVIAEARMVLGITQAELASMTGLSRSLIGKLETYAVTNISIGTLSALSKAFAVPIFTLILGPSEWDRLTAVALSQNTLTRRMKALSESTNPTEITRLEAMSKSMAAEDRLVAMREIDGYAMRVLMPDIPIDNKELREEIENSIGPSRRVASAIGTRMLPNQPILNAVIVGLVAIPFNTTTQTHGE